jgi:hypothetical protein
MSCECHREAGSHELCCGHDQGRNPDCSIHGDGGCPEETGQIITVKQAAEMLKVSGMTIRRLIDMGKLPAWRVAGDGPVRLNSLDVEAMRVPVFPPATTGVN